jgi:uncharacterized OB-fold protein
MKEFYDFLNRGEFRIPICDNCGAKIWPPTKFCNYCYSKKIRMSKLNTNGQIIEYTQSYIGKRNKLGVVEISGIRVIGILDDGAMNSGSSVKLSKCGVDRDNSPFFEFSSA